MALQDFSLGASDPSNPNAIVLTPTQQQLRMAAALSQMKAGADYSPIQSPWQGAARLADGLMGGLDAGRSEREQAAGSAQANAQLAALAAGLGGGGAAPATPAGSVAVGPIADAGGGQIPGASPPVASNTFSGPASVAPYANAIAKVESAGSGDYGALGPAMDSGDRAYGRYQVMGANIPQWTKAALGKAMTPQEFLASPQAQDAVFAQQFGNSMQKFGTPQDAASVWFTGRPLAQAGANASDGYSTNGQYQSKFARALAQQLAMRGGAPSSAAAYAPAAAPPSSGAAPAAIAAAAPSPAPVQVASLDPNFAPVAPHLSAGAVPMPGGGVAAGVNPTTGAPIPGAGNPGASPPVQVAANGGGVPAGPAIAVPGYDGQFTRAQANDGEGVPSQSEWDAAQAGAARGGQQVAGGPSAAAPAQAVPTPAAAPQNQAQIKAALAILQNPYSSPAAQQIAASVVQNATKQDQYSQPFKDQFGNVVQRGPNGEMKVLNAATTEKDTDTTDIKNFKFAKQQGFQGNFSDFEAAQKAAVGGNHVLAPGQILVGGKGEQLAKNEGAPEMSDETASFMADRILSGDTHALVGLGRGAQGAGNIAKIQKLVAEKAQAQGIDPSDILQKNAEAAGLNAQQRTFGTQTARMASASIEAEGGLLLARQASSQVPRGNWVPVNKLVQMGEDAVSDPALAKFRAANLTLINQYARAINPNGVPSIHDKEEATKMLSTATSPEAYNAVLDQMQQEITIAHNSPTKAKTMLENIRKGNTPESGVQAPSSVPAPSLAAPASAKQVIVNPSTGEKLMLDPTGTKWVPAQ